MAKLRAAIRAGTRGASRTRRTTTSSRSTSSSSRVRTGSASTSNTFRGNVTSSVKQSGSSKSGDVVKGQKVSVSASGGQHVSIGGTPRTPRTPRTPSAPRAPGTSRSAAAPASAASPEASSARLKLYMKRIAAGEPLPPSASRNPELVAKARELLGFGQGTATVKVELPPYKPPAAKGEPLTAIQLASARKPSSSIKPPAVLAKIDAALKPSKPLASYGDRGPVVATLQHYLQNRGFDPGPIDGVWGPKTQAAFTAFQKAGNVVDWSTIAAKTPEGAPEDGAYPVEGVKTGVTPASGKVTTTSGLKGLAQLAYLQGLRGQALIIAIAVGMAESAGNPNATNNNNNGSVDRGLWQINSIHGKLSTHDPYANARAMYQISNGGKNWQPWVTYWNGAYRRYLDDAQAVARSLGYV